MKVKKSVTLSEELVELLDVYNSNTSKAIEHKIALGRQNEEFVDNIERMIIDCRDHVDHTVLLNNILQSIEFHRMAEKNIRKTFK